MQRLPPAHPAGRFLHATLAGALLLAAGVPRARAAPPWVDGRAAGDAQAQLVQVTELVEQGQAPAAVELLLGLLDRAGGQLVADGEASGFTVYRPLRQVVFRRMLGPSVRWQAVRELYRQRVDPLVEAQWAQAWQEKDRRRLEWLVDTYFPSGHTDRILHGLAMLALEQGDAEVARQWWAQVAPEIHRQVAPSGGCFPDVPRVFPDTDLPPALLQACLVLTSIKQEAWDRAERELDVLAANHPDARGTLWGTPVEWVPALREWLSEARRAGQEPAPLDRWWTYGGNHQRQSVLSAGGGDPEVAWTRMLPPAEPIDSAAAQQFGLPEIASGDSFATPCRYFPLADRHHVYVPLADGFQVFDRADGAAQRTVQPLGELVAPQEGTAGGLAGLACDLGEISGDWIGLSVTQSQGDEPTTLLVVCDLQAEGRVEQILEAPGDWEFAGPPIFDDGRIWVAVARYGEMTRCGVAGFDLSTGRHLWTRPLVANADAWSRSRLMFSPQPPAPARLLTKVGPWLFVVTNLGAVACLEADRGEVQWVATYGPRVHEPANLLGRPWQRLRRPACGVYADGRLFAAPADYPGLFALDAATGCLLWQAQVPLGTFDATHLLGVVDGRLIATGRRVWWIDVQTGRLASLRENPYPFAIDSRLVGVGRGLIDGGTLYWPARDDQDWLIPLDAVTGEPAGPPLALPEAGNLARSGRLLLVAGASQLTALKLHPDREGRAAPPASRLTGGSSGTIQQAPAGEPGAAEGSPPAQPIPGGVEGDQADARDR